MDIYTALYGLFLAGAVYGGIRADIRAIHRDIATEQRERRALAERFDTHLDRRQ